MLLQSILFCVGIFQAGAAPQAPPIDMSKMTTYRFVFLNRGKSRAKYSEAELEAMQKEHIHNLELLAEEGKGLAAGPLGEDGEIRGVVILKLGEKEDVKSCFTRDPFVQKGLLAVESYNWMTWKDVLKAPDTPFKMAEYSLAIYKKGPKFDANKMQSRVNEHVSFVAQLFESGVAALAGPFIDGEDKVGIFIFRDQDLAKMQTVLESDPMVREGLLKPEMHHLYMAKGIFKDRKGF